MSLITIDSFGDLSKHFVVYFLSYRVRQKNASHIFTICQKAGESLEVEDHSDKVVIMVIMEGLRLGALFDSLSKNIPETLSVLQDKAYKYIIAKELVKD